MKNQENLIIMSKLNDLLKSRMIPTHALIFYKSSVNVSEKGAYVEHRNIKDGVMGAAEPLEVRTLSNIMKVVDKYVEKQVKMTSLHGRIPEGLLYASSETDNIKLVWYRKPEERMMYFSECLGIPGGVMKVPGLVYSSDGKYLSVYAFKGSRPKSVLYNAPFFNVNGLVCLGSAKVNKPKENTYSCWIEYWETMFWKSEFVHILGANPIKGNLATITKDCILNKRPFPIDELVKSKFTIEKLLK